jgi:putative flippase GtrA
MRKFFQLWYVFGKAQVSAFLGGLTDYMVMIFFTEVFGLHFTLSIAIGGIVGAIVNFSLNRGWTFRSKDLSYRSSLLKQISKFAVVVLNSIFLKSSGVYYITTFLKIDYKISRILTDMIVSLLLNFTLQRYWVFRKQKVMIRKTNLLK